MDTATYKEEIYQLGCNLEKQGYITRREFKKRELEKDYGSYEKFCEYIKEKSKN